MFWFPYSSVQFQFIHSIRVFSRVMWYLGLHLPLLNRMTSVLMVQMFIDLCLCIESVVCNLRVSHCTGCCGFGPVESYLSLSVVGEACQGGKQCFLLPFCKLVH